MENTNERRYKFMRLYNIYYVCVSCLPSLEKVKTVEIRNANKEVLGIKIEEWADCKIALNELYKISCLKECVLSTLAIFNDIEKDQYAPSVSPDRGRKFVNELRNLRSSINTIIRLYESLEIGESKTGIDVKIPKCESLKEYMEYLKDIDFVFSQCPFLLVEDERIEFNNVDVGSQWLTFLVVTSGTFFILNNLGVLVNKAIAIKSNLLFYKQQEEQLRAMRLKNEVMEETVDVFKQMKQKVLNDSVNELESEIGELKDGEERGKVEKSLEKMVMLIDKGVEIYSSIQTPNEVKALFPTNENNPILPDNIIKLLEVKSDKNQDNK